MAVARTGAGVGGAGVLLHRSVECRRNERRGPRVLDRILYCAHRGFDAAVRACAPRQRVARQPPGARCRLAGLALWVPGVPAALRQLDALATEALYEAA